MLWLFDSAGDQSAFLPDASSIITTDKLEAHSTIEGELPLSAFDALRAARYCQVQGEEEAYVLEHVQAVRRTIDNELDEHVEIGGRSVTSLAHLRAIEGTMIWAATAPGAMVKDILESFTGERALPLAFGVGDTLGTATSMQRSWKDAGEVIGEIVSAAGLGIRGRMVGSTPTLDVYEPNDTGLVIGDKHGDGSASAFTIDDSSWRNYAIVLGQGVGDERVRVDVDLTDGGERRELVVDADDIKREGITEAAYEELLTQRGIAKLSETRKVQYGEAEVGRVLRAGDIVYYDAKIWAAELMVTEARTIREGGVVRREITLGWPERGVWETVARVSRGATNIAGGTVHVVGAAGEPAFTASWASSVQPRFYLSSSGEVVIEGGLNGESATLSTSAFTLPVGYRPPSPRYFACVDYNGAHAYVRIDTNGSLVPVIGDKAFISLDGIRFLPA